MGQLNVTDVSQLVTGIIGALNSTNPMQSVLSTVKAQIPALIVPPHIPLPNITSALAFIGNLVHSASGRCVH